jgi:4-diphosphocytidyl-2-C-methyl-D-erythritol kinase
VVGLGRLWGRPLPEPARLLALGADVPVCVAPGPCFVGGIGEQLARAPALPRGFLVLANPRRALPTVDVFRGYGRGSAGRFSMPARFGDAPADVGALAARLAERGNDLSAAAIGLVPEVSEVIAALAASPGCLLARMSGSGATCFGLFATEEAAAKAAAVLHANAPHWWVRATAMAQGGAVVD